MTKKELNILTMVLLGAALLMSGIVVGVFIGDNGIKTGKRFKTTYYQKMESGTMEVVQDDSSKTKKRYLIFTGNTVRQMLDEFSNQ